MKLTIPAASVLLALSLTGCSTTDKVVQEEIYGTKEPFAAQAIYFVLTDRFVDGDPTNNHEQQHKRVKDRSSNR